MGPRGPQSIIMGVNTGDKVVMPHTEEEPNVFLKKMLFVDYLADPTNNTAEKGLRQFSEATGVPIHRLRSWKNSRGVAFLVARRAREMAFEGTSVATYHREAMKIIEGGDLDPGMLIDRFLDKAYGDNTEAVSPGQLAILHEFISFLKHKGFMAMDKKLRSDMLKTLIREDNKLQMHANKMRVELDKLDAKEKNPERKGPGGVKPIEVAILEAESRKEGEESGERGVPTKEERQLKDIPEGAQGGGGSID